ncbi:MAG: FAD-dependent oxidoreductase, partial [Deltaproteobacteria bacterium]|nr:FAD-dependent oxidoreductase [Deltaproteobacteria bacterium]
MTKHLVLVGGGHAHLTVLRHVDKFVNDGHQVTLIAPCRYHYYSGMGSGLLSGIYRPQDIRFNIQKMIEDRGGAFVENRAVRIDTNKRCVDFETGGKIKYDVLSVNTGSYVPKAGIPDSEPHIYPVKPIENLFRARQEIIDRLRHG